MADASTDDEPMLRKVFPNEVWVMILRDVKDAPNYNRISNASSHFRSHLLPRAPRLLFADVANYLVERYADVESLTMRQVCRDWRKGVDQTLQTQDYTKQQLMRYCNLATVFVKEEDFTSFEQHFDPTHHLAEQVNPFLSRGVIIKMEYENLDDLGLAPLEPFYAACIRLLQKYGHHLWYLTIFVVDMNDLEGLLDFYKRRLPAILQLTPNLRVLGTLGPWDLYPDGFVQHALDRDNVEQLPFPNLPQLRSLCLCEMPLSVVRELVVKSPHVYLVQAGCTPEIISIYAGLLPKLKEIRFGCIHPAYFQVFRNAKVSGRIETLWLDMFLGRVPWEEIFSALESKFSEYLTELRLCLPSFFDEDANEAPKLALPNLKRLTLSMNDDAWPLDFLLPMRNTLEYLRVELWLGEVADTDAVVEEASELEKKAAVKLYGCWKELKMSSAWTQFPKLQLLQTAVYRKGEEADTREECYSCTKDQYRNSVVCTCVLP